ncbi:MAG: D-2-hydroxyacid dehydrogenase [Dehalococcoidia bacterium]
MDSVQVVVTIPLPPHLLERIRAVDARVRLTLPPPAQRHLFREGRPLPMIYQDPPPVDLSPAVEQAERARLDATLATTEVLMTPTVVPRDLLQRTPRLRWLQVTSAGIDRLHGHPILDSHVIITNASGIHAVPIAEFVLAYMLYFTKELPRALANQRQRRWQGFVGHELHGRTVGIVGMGAIGREVARLAKALNMRVLALRRSAAGEGSSPLADQVLPPSRLDYLLVESDYVVLAVPLTHETRGLIGEKELRSMKPTACLINIARGTVVESDALARALRQGWIAAAALDVTSPEPLPPDSDLWQLPNLLITPHMTSTTDRYVERAVGVFCDNLRRYLGGEPLLNVVDTSRGY